MQKSKKVRFNDVVEFHYFQSNYSTSNQKKRSKKRYKKINRDEWNEMTVNYKKMNAENKRMKLKAKGLKKELKLLIEENKNKDYIINELLGKQFWLSDDEVQQSLP